MPKSPDPLLSLLTAALRHEPDPAPFAPLDDATWLRLADLAQKHGLFIPFYRFVQQNGFDFSEPLRERFDGRYRFQTRYTILKCAELLTLLRLAETAGIPLYAFKGPVLAQIAYGDLTLRQFSDLDLLIRREDFRAFASLLQERGYRPHYPLDAIPGDKALFEMNNDCPFYDEERLLSVEMHWDLFRNIALPTSRIAPWEAGRTVTVNGRPVATMSHETHLLYHALHGSKHLWEKMLWIVDIDRFIRAVPTLDWDALLARARELGALKMFLLGPALAQRLFETPLPAAVDRACREAGLEAMIASVLETLGSAEARPENNVAKLFKIIALRDSPRFKAKTLFEFLFRPGINERRIIVLPDALFWLYWPLRPLGMLYRLLTCRFLRSC